MTNRVLLIGSGAREHCIADSLKKSQLEIYSVVSNMNPGVIELSKEFEIGDICDPEVVLDFARRVNPSLAVIGPEAPLEAGISDALWDAGIPCVGPKKVLARIETSKGFCRQIMKEYGIDGRPEFKYFENMNGLQDYMNTLPGIVVKPDGLTGGKGVWVEGDHFEDISEIMDYAQSLFEKGEGVVVEEKLEGEEFSQFYFTDGSSVVGMPIAQDHKRALEGDKGPNTGGMGSYSDADHLLPFINEEDVKQATNMTREVIKALKDKTGEDYKGIIYGGFIKTKNGVKLIEYNARVGDPEVMNVLPLLKSDLFKIFESICAGNLKNQIVEFERAATVCKYLVPEGYPDSPVKNKPIVQHKFKEGAKIFYASVDKANGSLILKGSRALAFVGIAPTISAAEKIAQDGVESIEGPVFYRRDIGTFALIKKRIDHMNSILDR